MRALSGDAVGGHDVVGQRVRDAGETQPLRTHRRPVYIVVIDRGAIIAEGTPAQLKSLRRHVSGDRDALHDAAVREVVAARVVLSGTVVPERDRAGRPVQAHLEVGHLDLVEQEP